MNSMKSLIKAEFRKLATVRSTYVIGLFAAGLIALFAFFVEGYSGISASPAEGLTAGSLNNLLLTSVTTIGVFIAITTTIQSIHEFRFNTITYTLTAAGSRHKVWWSKFIVAVIYGAVFTVAALLFSMICYYAGLALRGASLPPQDIDLLYVLGRSLFYGIGYSLLGLFLGTLVRSVALAVVSFFVLPSVVEPMLGVLLKDKADYLPFAALEQVIAAPLSPYAYGIGASRAALVWLGYLIAFTAISWYLFVRRDAR